MRESSRESMRVARIYLDNKTMVNVLDVVDMFKEVLLVFNRTTRLYPELTYEHHRTQVAIALLRDCNAAGVNRLCLLLATG